MSDLSLKKIPDKKHRVLFVFDKTFISWQKMNEFQITQKTSAVCFWHLKCFLKKLSSLEEYVSICVFALYFYETKYHTFSSFKEQVFIIGFCGPGLWLYSNCVFYLGMHRASSWRWPRMWCYLALVFASKNSLVVDRFTSVSWSKRT